MKLFFYLSLVTLISCGGGKSSSVKYGKTTRADLVSAKGEPLDEQSVPVKNNQILIYDDNEKYQLDGDVVTHGYKDPKGEQRTLIYWKHHFKDCETQTKTVTKAQGHSPAELELSCSSEGLKVIYTEGSEYISRVVEYESK